MDNLQILQIASVCSYSVHCAYTVLQNIQLTLKNRQQTIQKNQIGILKQMIILFVI